jgi:uncharacterized integral membrane protein
VHLSVVNNFFFTKRNELSWSWHWGEIVVFFNEIVFGMFLMNFSLNLKYDQ